MMNVRSLHRLKGEGLERLVIDDLELSAKLVVHQRADIFESFPAPGTGALAVQDAAAIKDPEAFATEVRKRGYAYLLVNGDPEGVVGAFRSLPSNLSVDGVIIEGATLLFRVVVSHSFDQSAQLFADFASLFVDREQVISEIVYHAEPRIGGLRQRLFDIGVRIVKPLKDYLPTPVIVALYRFAHYLRGK